MAASFPTSAKSFAEKRNNIDIYDASHMNDVQNEIMAMQTAMGIEGQGSSPSLSARSRRTVTAVVSRDKTGDYYCDGVADDVQIQAAIDAVGALGGGTVIVRAGTYVIGTQIDLDSANVHVAGEGMGATILQAKAAFPTQTYVVSMDNNRVSIEDLTIDGNKANQTTEEHIGIKTDNSGNSYQDIYIINCEIKNMNLNSGTTYGAGIYLESLYHKVIACHIHDCEGYGVFANDNFFTISGSTINNNSLAGVLIEGNYGNVNGNIIYLNTQEGIITSAATKGNIVSNTVMRNGKDQIEIGNGSSDFVITGNNIDTISGLDADNTYSGILITGSSVRNVVTGNRIDGNGSSNDLQYGIREAAVADNYNNISGNIVDGADTAQVSIQGANTVSDGTNVVA